MNNRGAMGATSIVTNWLFAGLKLETVRRLETAQFALLKSPELGKKQNQNKALKMIHSIC